jgi:hypothetical protein
MFALRSRPSPLLAGHPATRRPIPRAASFPLSANTATPPQTKAHPCAVPRKNRTESNAPLFSAGSVIFTRSFMEERNTTPLFSVERALFRSRLPRQPQHSQLVTDSFTDTKILSPAFSVTSALFVRSSADERTLTHVLSVVCALFGKTTREGVGVSAKKNPNSNFKFIHTRDRKVRYSNGLHSGPDRSPGTPVNSL